MTVSDQLESKLSEVFEKKAPRLPAKGKQFIVKYASWASLITGVLTLWSAWTLWEWAHVANMLVGYANTVCGASGFDDCAAYTDHLSLWIWLGLAVLVVEGVLYLLAYPGLKARKKAGWNYLYWGALVNVAYAVVSLLSGYSSLGAFLIILLGTAIGFWLLFQVRSSYTGERARARALK